MDKTKQSGEFVLILSSVLSYSTNSSNSITNEIILLVLILSSVLSCSANSSNSITNEIICLF